MRVTGHKTVTGMAELVRRLNAACDTLTAQGRHQKSMRVYMHFFRVWWEGGDPRPWCDMRIHSGRWGTVDFLPLRKPRG